MQYDCVREKGKKRSGMMGGGQKKSQRVRLASRWLCVK